LVLGPEPIKQFHERMVKVAQTNNIVAGRRMRVDTTVTETNILRAAARNILNAEHIVMRS